MTWWYLSNTCYIGLYEINLTFELCVTSLVFSLFKLLGILQRLDMSYSVRFTFISNVNIDVDAGDFGDHFMT